jgi:hypothetical protein
MEEKFDLGGEMKVNVAGYGLYIYHRGMWISLSD